MENDKDNKNSEVGAPSNGIKLLFITQKVDKDDDVLGVYHRWIEELAKKFDQINVICLYRGRVELPDNVRVFSLGKEGGGSIVKYLFNFYKYLWRLRGGYDRVFVHMNPEYMILAGLLWRIAGKQPILWYNHPMGDWKARIAIAIADRVLHTSPFAFAARYKKAMIMPVGIDTDMFRNLEIERLRNSVLCIGRISPIKKLEILLQAISILRTSGVQKIKLTIAGAPTEGKLVEFEYYEKIKKMAAELDLGSVIEFKLPVPNYETPMLYNTHSICVNMTPAGSFDKTIIEAMACELPVIVSNRALKEIFPPELADKLMFEERNSEDLANKIQNLLKLSSQEEAELGKTMRLLIIKKHSLNVLMDKLTEIFHFDF